MTRVIAIASGKGGVGKTSLTANLGVAMAKMGYATVAMDMDLGGSNLHSFLGLPNRFPGIGDFLKAGNKELEAFLVSTDIPHLKFLSGDGRTPFLANISYARKVRLISDIKKLPADYIFLDLGAGTSFKQYARQGCLFPSRRQLRRACRSAARDCRPSRESSGVHRRLSGSPIHVFRLHPPACS